MEEIIRDDAGSITYHLNANPKMVSDGLDSMANGIGLLPVPINLNIKERFGQFEVQCWLHSEIDGEQRSQQFRVIKSFMTYDNLGRMITRADALNILYYTVRELLIALNLWINNETLEEHWINPTRFIQYKLNKEKMWVTGEFNK